MPRYVLLHHGCPASYRSGPHWDLMLERDGVLRTWSLPENPWPASEAITLSVERLADHRILYLDYEGPLSGDRGDVERVAAGEFEWGMCEEERAVVRILSGPLAGELELVRTVGEWWLLWRQ